MLHPLHLWPIDASGPYNRAFRRRSDMETCTRHIYVPAHHGGCNELDCENRQWGTRSVHTECEASGPIRAFFLLLNQRIRNLQRSDSDAAPCPCQSFLEQGSSHHEDTKYTKWHEERQDKL